MKVTQHQGKSLLYLNIQPDDHSPDRDYPLVVLLHGFGATMHDLASLAPAISPTGYFYVCPQAPMRFDFGQGQAGYGWTPRGDQATPEDVKRAEEALDTLIAEAMESHKVPPGRVMLVGFSQGGVMAYRSGLRQPHLYAGIAALSSFIPQPEELKRHLSPERTMPIFISHGTLDMVLPIDRGRAARDFLVAEGYQPAYHEYTMAHEITQQVVRDLVQWTSRVLPPLTQSGG